uniref:Dynein heavy chain coiled coil stalk domain-containing protein n=1 Tax=Chromera velia CCMP2878 TaxID=1169474 RepID=A0A0G4GMG2_9ALVE|eukprot:Cvel_22555.t1-p1 / transcript=Cvel_22555.t1 / gene=Cvel_22555 / organism=Chromera_velia_CCMP2878 / gene_product=hypothetical protein / transcript_product=hypothetical protein / location=Cvel_scaffold2227:28268-29428(+) / protein_length=180 / sequence_SO=supercontig / SO=protein_coding / is_pseudo=false
MSESVTALEETVRLKEAECREKISPVVDRLSECEQELGKLTKMDVNQFKAMSMPPSSAVELMRFLCICLGEPTDWTQTDDYKTALFNLSKQDVVDRMKHVVLETRDEVSAEILPSLKPFLEDANDSFSVNGMRMICPFCGTVSLFVQTVAEYVRVREEVRPLREELVKLTAQLNAAKEAA